MEQHRDPSTVNICRDFSAVGDTGCWISWHPYELDANPLALVVVALVTSVFPDLCLSSIAAFSLSVLQIKGREHFMDALS